MDLYGHEVHKDVRVHKSVCQQLATSTSRRTDLRDFTLIWFKPTKNQGYMSGAGTKRFISANKSLKGPQAHRAPKLMMLRDGSALTHALRSNTDCGHLEEQAVFCEKNASSN